MKTLSLEYRSTRDGRSLLHEVRVGVKACLVAQAFMGVLASLLVVATLYDGWESLPLPLALIIAGLATGALSNVFLLCQIRGRLKHIDSSALGQNE